MAMKMTNNDDNDSNNINQTIKTFYFLKKFLQTQVVWYIEVIRPLYNIFSFYEKISHAQKRI